MAAEPSTMDGDAALRSGGLSLLSLVRLLQLASPTLPIGAYSYSQALERVIEDGTVRDAASTQAWIGDLLELVVARAEAPIVWRLLDAAQSSDWRALSSWNAWFRASRETAELRAETEQMGGSLAKLASDRELFGAPTSEALDALSPITLPAAFALAAHGFGIPAQAALTAYVWAWLDNQVLAAVKLVPLGQVAGQRLLVALGAMIPGVVSASMAVADDDLSTFAPGFALASARHETQYTRLFRS
jgi:urease accessory protein